MSYKRFIETTLPGQFLLLETVDVNETITTTGSIGAVNLDIEVSGWYSIQIETNIGTTDIDFTPSSRIQVLDLEYEFLNVSDGSCN